MGKVLTETKEDKERPSPTFNPVQPNQVIDVEEDEGSPMMEESLRAVPRGLANVASDIYGLSAAGTGSIGRMIYDTGDAEFVSHMTDLTGPDSQSAGNMLSSDPREVMAAEVLDNDAKDKLAAHLEKMKEMDEENVGFFRDFEESKASAFEGFNTAAEELLGFSLHPKGENLAQLSDAQLRTVGGIEAATAIGLPVGGAIRAGGAAIKAGASAARGGRAGMISAAQAAPGAALEAAKSAVSKPGVVYGGSMAGTGVGAAISKSEAETPAGQLADYTSGAGMGGLVGLLGAAGSKLLIQQGRNLTNWAMKNLGKAEDEAYKDISQWHSDIESSRKALSDADMQETPLGAGARGESVFGRAWRHGAQELGPADQRKYNQDLAKAQSVLGEKQGKMREGFQQDMGDSPTSIGSARTVNVDEQNKAVQGVVERSRQRMQESAGKLGKRYEDINREFDQTTIKGFKGKFVTEDMQKVIEDFAVIGDSIEADILGKVIPHRTSQTIDPMKAKGGFRRLLESIKANVKAGKTAEGTPGSIVSNFVHNANEILRKAEMSNDPAHQMKAREMVDYAYGLMDELVEQGKFHPDLVKRFRALQADAKEHYRVFYGGNPIGEALKEQKPMSSWKVASQVKGSIMTRGGNLREEGIHALYEATGDQAMVNDLIANTVNTRFDTPEQLFSFYEKNKMVLGSPTFGDLTSRIDDIAFNNMAARLGDKGEQILDFVRNMPDKQVKTFTGIVMENGTAAYKYMGYRILDEIANLPLKERMRYMAKNEGKISRMLSTPIGGKPELHDAFERMKRFTALEDVLMSHRPFDVAEPTSGIARGGAWLSKKIKDITGLDPVPLASAGRAIVRRILSVSTAYVGLVIPRQMRHWTHRSAQKYFLRTLAYETMRDAQMEKALLESVGKGKITDDLHTFLRAMAFNFGQTAYQPSRFTQERKAQIEREMDAEARRLLGDF